MTKKEGGHTSENKDRRGLCSGKRESGRESQQNGKRQNGVRLCATGSWVGRTQNKYKRSNKAGKDKNNRKKQLVRRGNNGISWEGWMCSHEENESIWKELKQKVKSAIRKNKKKISYIIPWQLGKREWHRVEDRKKIYEKNAKRSEERKD